MSDSKKENLFAKLAQQSARTVRDDSVAAEEIPAADTPPSPSPVETPTPRTVVPRKKPEPPKGKRDNPDYCQANAYVPKSLRRAVDKALIDIEGLDYSTLVTDLLRKWVKSRGVSE